MAYEY